MLIYFTKHKKDKNTLYFRSPGFEESSQENSKLSHKLHEYNINAKIKHSSKAHYNYRLVLASDEDRALFSFYFSDFIYEESKTQFGLAIGHITAFAGSPPKGFLPCNGQAVSKKQYAKLFSTIGNTYGQPDKTTFTLPDMSGQIPAGQGSAIIYNSLPSILSSLNIVYGIKC